MEVGKENKKNIIIIDCRYEYEFTGGHIIGAMNCSFPTQVYDALFASSKQVKNIMVKDSIIILHCEFSTFRAPKTYDLIRRRDRNLNESKYPLVFYPELYLLENGYKEFYHTYPVSKSFHKNLTFPKNLSFILSKLIYFILFRKLLRDFGLFRCNLDKNY